MSKKHIFILIPLAALMTLTNGFLPASVSSKLAYTTSTPTPTPTPSPTATPGFSFSTANRVAPDDILKEISYYPTGGPGYICSKDKYLAPEITYKYMANELVSSSMLIACGWQRYEDVFAYVFYPDIVHYNKIKPTIETERRLDKDGKYYLNNYYVTFTFKPSIDDPVGKYIVILKGESGSVKTYAEYKKPVGAHIAWADNNHILLYGFAPQENVRLFYFTRVHGENKVILAGWDAYKVDLKGQLLIGISARNGGEFVAIGERSGEVHMKEEFFLTGARDPIAQINLKLNKFCQGPPSRMNVGVTGRVAYTDGAYMRIRKNPGFNQAILSSVPEGTPITTIGGPFCVDKVTWWKIRTDKKLEGWMAETQYGVYLIEPVR
jgi:hypothetical protein